MRFYELTYIALPILEEKEIEALKEKVKNYIVSEKGEIQSELSPIKIQLGYPIQKFNEGFLLSLEFLYPQEKIEELDKKIKEEKNILRHLIIQKKRRIVKTAPKEKPKKPKKVELKELDQKLKEILEE